MIEFKGSHFEREVILWGVRWYLAYPISYRQLEEMMDERGVEVDHSTLNRWVLKYVPLLEKQFRVRKRPVGPSWRMDETYVRVKGTWKYLRFSPDAAVEKWPLRGSPATSRRCHWPMLPRHSVCLSPMDISVRRYAGGSGSCQMV